ncbi:MAG: phosphate-binding protein [Candidatus Altiarchaeales archaeon ex4484_2]|nr:MAG: phosphate-binding protein [Candidatus Altiarchaeales archaeon ex4484_2]
MKKKGIICLLFMATMMMLFSGCTSPPGDGGTGTTLATKKITIAGSTTVQPISNQAVEAYTAKNPNVKISVQGGGSGTGVRMVSEGSVDIGAASRDLKDSEMEATPSLVTHTIAHDGIAVIVHPGNSIEGLSLQQIQDIFAGKITNYREVGGPDMEIVVIIREEGSGTRATFEELVMDGGGVSNSEDVLQKPSNGAVRATVSGNENAISYVGLGYIDESVKALQVDGVTPSTATIGDGSYPISRNLYYITNGQPTGEVKRYIDFVKCSEGQKIVEKEGFIPLS